MIGTPDGNITIKPTEELQTLHLSTIGSDTETIVICMKGGYPYKKHTKYEGSGNKTQRKSKDEMARPLKRDIRISSEMATDAKRWSVMVKNFDNGLLDGKTRKQLVLENTIR